MLNRYCLISYALLVVPAIAAPPEPGFSLVSFPPGTDTTWVTGLTQDGGTAAGLSFGSVGPGFTWTKAGGRDDFGLLPGMPISSGAHGLSDNGVVVGSMNGFTNSRAYRWTGSGALQNLGVLPGFTRSFGSGVSGNDDVVVGRVEVGDLNGQAFRWTPTGGMQGLGWLPGGAIRSEARGVSRDGTTIVGENINAVLTEQAFKWTESGGMQALPNLPNAPLSAEANAVNADGSIIVGSAAAQPFGTHAVRWVDGTIEDLAVGFGLVSSDALAVSDTGSVVGGTYQSGSTSLAFLWSKSTGMMNAHDFLALYGVSVPSDYKLEYVYAVSGDGLTFGGQARNLLTNQREGFVATIPAPGGLIVVIATTMVALRRRREVHIHT